MKQTWEVTQWLKEKEIAKSNYQNFLKEFIEESHEFLLYYKKHIAKYAHNCIMVGILYV